MKHQILSTALFLIALMFTNYASSDTPDYIVACADCHGKNGISNEPSVPTIAGASAPFLEFSLFAYKDNQRPAVESKYFSGDLKRPATDMKKIVEPLSDAQITKIAEYFANQPFKAAQQTYNSSLVEIGSQVHNRKCKKCHEDGGSNPDDDSGILAGQWSLYLNQSMQHYRDGSREMDKKMKQKIDEMSEQEWEALVAFYASQQ